jgi:hypothetical protein
MDTDFGGQTSVWVGLAPGHRSVNGFSPWKSTADLASLLSSSVSIGGRIKNPGASHLRERAGIAYTTASAVRFLAPLAARRMVQPGRRPSSPMLWCASTSGGLVEIGGPHFGGGTISARNSCFASVQLGFSSRACVSCVIASSRRPSRASATPRKGLARTWLGSRCNASR